MKISAKTDYACRALLELALHWPSEAPLQIHTISQRRGIPMKFLTQILINLKQGGLVESLRGQKGGYILARAPQEITLKEVVQNFLETGYTNHGAQRKKNASVFNAIWQEITEETSRVMEKITFDEIVKRERNLNKVPMFTI